MKKILSVALFATLLAAGCQKTDVINPVGNSMQFSTEMGKLTKAVGTPDAAATEKMANLQAQDFRVWAYCAYDNENTTAEDEKNTVYDGMAGMLVSYTPDNSEGKAKGWAPTDKEHYWPGVNKDLFFFAVSGADYYANDPENATAKADVSFPNAESKETPAPVDDKKMIISNFTVLPSNPNVDLMVADYVQQRQNKKEVALMFHHALSKVEFLFKTSANPANTRVLVQSIEVDGLDDKGTLTVTADEANKKVINDTQDAAIVASTTYPVVLSWSTKSSATSEKPVVFTDDYDTAYTDWAWPTTGGDSKIELADETGTIVDLAAVNSTDNPVESFDKKAMALTSTATPFATWLVLPQSIQNKKITITYIINKRQFKTILSLDQTIANWDKNQYIRYTVDLSPNRIAFKSEVKDWAQYDANTNNDADGKQFDDVEMQN